MDRYIGRLLDNRYEILEIIGVGGMAVVYKARDHRLNRLVAIKMLKDEFSNDEEFRRRFNAESQAVAMLSHPNIVGVYDVSECDGVNYIVMELIDGITLKEYMQRRGNLNWREVLHFSLQITKALEHAHSRGIIHRDIKPHNVMVLKDGSVKVADFGIARVVSAQNTLTREALGSVHYISPEQAKGGRTDCRSDLYSLGVVMYEMMTAQTPFDGETPVAVAIQHISGKATMPRELNPEIPAGLEQICMHAMTADIDARYPNAAQLLQDLEEFRKNPEATFIFHAETGKTITKKSQSGSGKRETRKAKAVVEEITETEEDARHRRALTLIYILCGIAIIGLGILLFNLIGLLRDRGNNMVPVPQFVGMNSESINPAEYSDFILEPAEVRFDDSVPFGHVISQSPESGVNVERGTTVSLVISRGPRTDKMPKLTNLTVSAAEELLDDLELGLTVILDYANSSEFEKGSIINSNPVYGVVLEQGQRVTLYVSLGVNDNSTNMKTVPPVTEMTLETAEQALVAAGLQVGKITWEESDAAENTVIRQAIESGQQIAEGTAINLTVSSGREKKTVPYLMGKNIDTAKLAITNAGLTVGNITPVENDAPENQVIEQSITAGEQAEPGTVINLTVSTGPAPHSEIISVKLPKSAEATCSVVLYLDGEQCYENPKAPTATGKLTVRLEVKSGQTLAVFINGTEDTAQTRIFE